MSLIYILLSCCSFLVASGLAQSNPGYLQADPLYLSRVEKGMLSSDSTFQSFDIRPLINQGPESGLDIRVYGTSRLYYNDNAPNLENTGEMWIGKGITSFHSIHLDVNHEYFFLSLEPYYQYASNLPFTSYHLNWDPNTSRKYIRKFMVLNDGPGRGLEAVNELKLREVQAYVHKNGIGGGVTNSGMWWGPGIHSSLNMTNNTTGIPRVVLGTIREQRFAGFGLVAQYIFAKLEENKATPYFSATVGSITSYSNPIITLGASRSFLSGGTLSGESVSWQDAAKLPIQPFFKKQLITDETGPNPIDKTDQTFSAFLSFLFPESHLKMFLEYGWNDHRWDWYDFRAHPDHSGASVLGFRKYGLFNRPELVLGFEYTNLMRSQFYPQRATPDWYGRQVFDYSTYDGRRYAAHSGSDSDDMLLYLGYITPKQSFTLAFDYERHGIIYSVQLLELSDDFRFPESKIELRADYKRNFSFGQIYIYYEFEFAENMGSPVQGVAPRIETPERKANVFGLEFRSKGYSF